MRYLFIISLLVFNFVLLNAQTNSKIGVGLNMTNNISNLLSKNYSHSGGFAFEPTIVYKFHEILNVKATLGYSKISNERILRETINSFQEINYINIGGYFKIGMNLNFNNENRLFNNSMGLSIGYSKFTDNGNLLIKGEYFGDYNQPYKIKNQQAIFIDYNIDLVLFRYNRITLLTNFNLPFLVYTSFDSNYPGYFIPGYGERLDIYNLTYFYYRINIHLMISI